MARYRGNKIGDVSHDAFLEAYRCLTSREWIALHTGTFLPDDPFDDRQFVGMEQNPELVHLFGNSPMLSQGDLDNAPRLARKVQSAK